MPVPENHAVLARALVRSARQSTWENVNPYITHHLPNHGLAGGVLHSIVGDQAALKPWPTPQHRPKSAKP